MFIRNADLAACGMPVVVVVVVVVVVLVVSVLGCLVLSDLILGGLVCVCCGCGGWPVYPNHTGIP
jgi:hypothetical protein